MTGVSKTEIEAFRASHQFDEHWYVQQYPDVKLVGMDPAEHFLWIGRRLGRHPSSRTTQLAAIPEDLVNLRQSPKQTGNNPARTMHAYLGAPTENLPPLDGYPITRFMYYLWNSRLDLKSIFDLQHLDQRIAFCEWYVEHARQEYGLSYDAYPLALLQKLAHAESSVASLANELLGQGAVHTSSKGNPPTPLEPGANLIGYARGEFGMGEHVRMVASSLAATSTPFHILDVSEGGIHGENDHSADHWIDSHQRHETNIFHINADVLPSLYFRFGHNFFSNAFNIGYWAWELSEAPPEFDLAFNMMDEVWGISDFVADAFRARSPVPVLSMPLAVSLPKTARSYSKPYFGLRDDHFTFLFTFDSASYLERKNPIAVVRAFKSAFPKRHEKVRLVLKTMNPPHKHPLWEALIAESQSDSRIEVITTRLTRDEVLGLCCVADAFVSLHRSEGFGRCIAEAMLMGKPVISTNYSGSLQFAREGTAAAVDYRLIPVADCSYPFWQGQHWADPDIEHAAWHMRQLAGDAHHSSQLARAGATFIRENFNERVIGAAYEERLRRILHRSSGWQPSLERGNIVAPSKTTDILVGSIDVPEPTASATAQNRYILIAGWAAAAAGIDGIDIYCDGIFVGEAHHGLLRADIAQCHPNLPDAGRSGFSFLLDTSNCSLGPHTITVKARSISGNSTEWKRGFLIQDPNQAYELWLESNRNCVEECQLSRQTNDAPDAPPILTVVVTGAPSDYERTLSHLSQQIDRRFDVVIASGDRLGPNTESVEISGISVRVVPGDWTEAVRQSRGLFICLLSAGDLLDERTIIAIADNLQACSDIDLFYCDEDQLVGNRRCRPLFKPSWSPIFFESYDYIGRAWFVRRTLLLSIISNGVLAYRRHESQLLRDLTPLSARICHIPMILYTRSSTENGVSTAQRSFPPSAERRTRVRWPRISIIVPTRLSNEAVVERCFQGLLNSTDYPDFEVLVVANNLNDMKSASDWLGKWPVNVLSWNQPYNWSAINNFGSAQATGEMFLFLNDDIEPLDPRWLKYMVELAARERVGAVGATLFYPNHKIQHAGIHVARGHCRHTFRFLSGTEEEIAWLASHNREQLGLTGACLLTRRDCFLAVGGFDESLPLVCNDVDFCLRLREQGLTSVVSASAQLMHYEGLSRAGMAETEDIMLFWSRWGEALAKGDPFFNPNLNAARDDWSVSPVAHSGPLGRIGLNSYS